MTHDWSTPALTLSIQPRIFKKDCSLVTSYINTTPSAFRKYCLVMLRNLQNNTDLNLARFFGMNFQIGAKSQSHRSCPAVSHSWTATTRSSSLIVLTVKSTPMVALNNGLNRSWQNRCKKHVLPTAESPTKTTLKMRSGLLRSMNSGRWLSY